MVLFIINFSFQFFAFTFQLLRNQKAYSEGEVDPLTDWFVRFGDSVLPVLLEIAFHE